MRGSGSARSDQGSALASARSKVERSSARRATIAHVSKPSPYSVVSLYSGAGGLDAGFELASFEVEWAIDSDAFAVRSYNANLRNPRAVCGDVLTVPPPEGLAPDVVIGGPPCQGFSVIGRMDPDDPRSQHVEHFLDIVEALQPRAFVMENVKALGENPRWAPIRHLLLARAERLGYECKLFILNAADYGVPQARERMFLIGLQDEVPKRPRVTSAGSPPTVRESLSRLPHVGEPGNDGICSARVIPAKRPIMRPSPFRGSLLFNGSGRPLELDAPAKTLPASMGGNATPIVDQDELDHGAEPWAAWYHRHLSQGGRPRTRAPRRMRRITVQEAAALQTFPATWALHGPQVAQYRQVGNAVPPDLARAVAATVRDALARADATATRGEVLLAA
jgi:DNA (cytosine-5)-methyltransferase 1